MEKSVKNKKKNIQAYNQNFKNSTMDGEIIHIGDRGHSNYIEL